MEVLNFLFFWFLFLFFMFFLLPFFVFFFNHFLKSYLSLFFLADFLFFPSFGFLNFLLGVLNFNCSFCFYFVCVCWGGGGGKPLFCMLGNCLNKEICHMQVGSFVKWWTMHKINVEPTLVRFASSKVLTLLNIPTWGVGPSSLCNDQIKEGWKSCQFDLS